MQNSELADKLQQAFSQAKNAGLTKQFRLFYFLRKALKLEGYFTSPDKLTTFYVEIISKVNTELRSAEIYLVYKQAENLWHFIGLRIEKDIITFPDIIDHAYYAQDSNGAYILQSEKKPAAIEGDQLDTIIKNYVTPFLSIDRYTREPAGVVRLTGVDLINLSQIYSFADDEVLEAMTKEGYSMKMFREWILQNEQRGYR